MSEEQRLGRYIVEDQLGEGSFAWVYKGYDEELDRRVALKVLKPIWLSDASAVSRFKQEARTMAKLHHPNIAVVFEVGEMDGQVFLAQFLVNGDTLSAQIEQDGAMAWGDMIKTLRMIGSALDYAHSHDMIHRDIKPANILIDDKKQAYLGDFGLVRAAEGSASISASTGGMVGTPAYMAPEQWEDKEISPATDVYALSCVVVEMLTGKMLFDGSTPATVMKQHLMEGPRFPPKWPEGVPEQVAKVLKRGLAEYSADRIQTAGELVSQLEQAAEAQATGVLQVPPVWLVSSDGQRHRLKLGKTTLGRGKDARIQIDTDMISRHHATINFTGQQLTVVDEGSANGTFINERQIGSEPAFLNHGNVLTIGDVSFTVEASGLTPVETDTEVSSEEEVVAAVVAGAAATKAAAEAVSVASDGAETETAEPIEDSAAGQEGDQASGSLDTMVVDTKKEEAPPPVAATPTPATAPAEKSSGGGKGMMIVGAVVVLLIIGAAAFFLFGGGGGSSDTASSGSASGGDSAAVAGDDDPTDTPEPEPTDTVPAPTDTPEPKSTDTPKPEPTATETEEAEEAVVDTEEATEEAVEEDTPTPEPTEEATEEAVEEDTPTPEPTEEVVVEADTPTPEPTEVVVEISGNIAIPLQQASASRVIVADTEGNQVGFLDSARQPAHTQDGSKLVINGDNGPQLLLQVANSDGSSPEIIGDRGLNNHSHPAWSPDGKQVIYNDRPAGSDYFIYTRPIDDSSPGFGVEVAAAGIGPTFHANPLYPHWTSQGFIFRGCSTWSGQGGDCGMWLIQGGQGGEAKVLTGNANHIPTDADNSTVIYSSNEDGDWNVYSLNISSGATTQLTSDPSADALGTISPDGNTVAFLSNRGGGLAVWYVSIDGGDPEKMFDINADWGILRGDGWSEEKLSWGK